MHEDTMMVAQLSIESYEKRKPTLDKANAAAAKKGLTLNKLGEACNLLNVRVGAILSGQAPLEKATQGKLESALGLSSGSLDPLCAMPVRWQAGAIYRLHEAIEVYAPAIQRWFNEEFGDCILSAIDFSITCQETVGKVGERRMQVILDGKALQYSQDEGWRP